MVIAKSELAYR